MERHALERPHLIPLPATHYETAQVVYRTATVEGFIVWKQNQYSVPWRYLGQILPVRITPEEVLVYSPRMDAEIARHAVLPSTQSRQQRVDASHHPAPNDARQRVSVLKQRYEELGDTAGRFLEGLIQAQRYHWDHAQRVLALLGTYSRADVLAALERAMRYGAYAATSVERVLASQARPMGLLQRLAAESAAPSHEGDDSPAIAPRSTAEYQPLLPEEPTDAPPIENDAARNDPDSPREECPF